MCLRPGTWGEPNRLDVQYRKTKADQQAFGCTRTHFVAEGKELCVVTAFHWLREWAPERFGDGRDRRTAVPVAQRQGSAP